VNEDISAAEFARAVARIDSLTEIVARIEKKLDENIGDHEKRLRAIEKWMWTCIGLSVTGALSGLAAFFGGS
jgi:hypothetical protein